MLDRQTGYNNNVVNNYNNSYNEATDKDTLLDYAQICFLGEDYAEVARVCSIEKLKDISMVNTNLGYMFANGLYFKTDCEMAGEYYDKAIAMNSEQALNNKLAMYLRTHDVRAAELIYKGCEMRDEKVIDFFMLDFEDKIVLKDGSTKNEDIKQSILSRCNELLPDYMIPEEIEFRTDLPRTSRGKVDYRALEQEIDNITP